MIDTHAHLDSTFCDINKIVGLDAVILSGPNIEESKNNLLLASKYPRLYPAAGIHPQEIGDDINLLEELVKNPKIIAVGECGLEFLGEVNKEKQIEYFRKQIELAQKYKKPLIIHARKAVDGAVEILKEYKNISGVFHCYAGGIKRIKKIEELNFYFGIDGNLTYEDGLVDVVKKIPKDRLILETDCPYLTPVPFRGQENIPAYVKYVYEKVAEIWGESLDKTIETIDANAKKLFKL